MTLYPPTSFTELCHHCRKQCKFHEFSPSLAIFK